MALGKFEKVPHSQETKDLIARMGRAKSCAMETFGRIFKTVLAFVLLGVLSLLKWSLRLSLAVVDAAGAYVGDTLVDRAEPSKAARQRPRRGLLREDSPPQAEVVSGQDSKIVPITASVPQSKRQSLIDQGWTLISDSKKDGIAVLKNSAGEELMVNTRTWEPFAKVGG